MAIEDVKILQFPKIHDPRGNLTFVEHPNQLPFPIERVYWLYDVPSGSERGGHSHYEQHECLVAISGSFDVKVDDGGKTSSFHLNRPFQGLHIPPGIWRELDNFSSGAICLVMNSGLFAEEDYQRDYETFVNEQAALKR